MSEKKKIFWREFADRDSTVGNSVIITEEEMHEQVRTYFDEYGDRDFGSPVFEPIMMTQEEFDTLPEFEGF